MNFSNDHHVDAPVAVGIGLRSNASMVGAEALPLDLEMLRAVVREGRARERGVVPIVKAGRIRFPLADERKLAGNGRARDGQPAVLRAFHEARAEGVDERVRFGDLRRADEAFFSAK